MTKEYHTIKLYYNYDNRAYTTRCFLCGGEMTLDKPKIHYSEPVSIHDKHGNISCLYHTIDPNITLTNLHCATCHLFIPELSYFGAVSIYSKKQNLKEFNPPI